jgi:Tfp pilus assembly protein FimT
MRAGERGYTFIELIVGVIVVGMLVLMMMPSMQGAQVGREVQVYADLAVAQLHQAKMEAAAQEQDVQWAVFYDTRPFNWIFQLGNGGSPMQTVSQVTVPPPVRMSGICYRGHFNPNGTLSFNCSGPQYTGEVEWLCFDADVVNGPMILVEVNTTTGQIVEQTTAGTCTAP